MAAIIIDGIIFIIAILVTANVPLKFRRHEKDEEDEDENEESAPASLPVTGAETQKTAKEDTTDEKKKSNSRQNARRRC